RTSKWKIVCDFMLLWLTTESCVRFAGRHAIHLRREVARLSAWKRHFSLWKCSTSRGLKLVPHIRTRSRRFFGRPEHPTVFAMHGRSLCSIITCSRFGSEILMGEQTVLLWGELQPLPFCFKSSIVCGQLGRNLTNRIFRLRVQT